MLVPQRPRGPPRKSIQGLWWARASPVFPSAFCLLPFFCRLHRSFRLLDEELKERSPAALALYRLLHLCRARSHAIEVAMLEIHARRAIGLRREAHLDFARLAHVGLEAPLMGDLPRP